MTIDVAKQYLINLVGPSYKKYIITHLAGDFAISLVKELKKKTRQKNICSKNPKTCSSIPPNSCGPDCHGYKDV